MANLRAPQTAARIGISNTTLYNKIRKGEFPAGIKLGPRLVVWPEEVVDAWLAEKRKHQQAQLDSILAAAKAQ